VGKGEGKERIGESRDEGRMEGGARVKSVKARAPAR